MSRGSNSPDNSTNTILYGDADPRTPTDTLGQVLVDGHAYKSAIPRYVPEGHDAESTIKRLIIQWPSIAADRSQALNYLLCVLGTGHDWDEHGQLINSYEQEPEYWERNHINRPLLEDPEEQYQFLIRDEEKQRRHREESRAALSPEVRAASDKVVDDLMKRLVATVSEKVKADREESRLQDSDDLDEPMSDFRERQLRERAAEEAELNRKTREDAEQLAQLKEPLQHPYPLGAGCALLNFPDHVEDSWLKAIIETAELIKATPVEAYDEPGFDAERSKQKHDKNQDLTEKALARAIALREQRFA